jgi:NAD(P)-dependent dehydrogenase (short-subunit alcohol dehydrogenase family)
MAGTGRVVLVAGVGEGLGTATSTLLMASGAQVVGVARTNRSLDRIKRLATARGWSFRGASGDLRIQAEVDRVVGSVLAELGRIDGLAVLAGRWVPGETLVDRMSDTEWSDGIADNLTALFRLCRAVLPSMLKRRSGAIVLVSAADRVRWDGSASYAVAKGGILDLARKMARDYRPFGIRVNAVLPGNMPAIAGPVEVPDFAADVPLTDTPPSGSWEVAAAIRYLLSDESRWVTGTFLTVDGGYSTWAKEARTDGSPP